jgi:hypothetical protein
MRICVPDDTRRRGLAQVKLQLGAVTVIHTTHAVENSAGDPPTTPCGQVSLLANAVNDWLTLRTLCFT